ncbi:MAG: Asp-tRNA(Asn)/Glu-tRNA(Gln) amidotransferase subunit GatB [Candidatus Paceibacterota bacterium]|nr:Asp-tRNA(Asn)/Glu-tRNA(Gln) amidotransferase subunit GatB [Candidatus Paceibacterota bacterium]MDD4201302.1 Asp-tRNA(Asn)/Glu-tRNA(Gln) amidotransferase subunit GatB [Candidatus Paceibacterota bacterium]MDD4467399.1 Asp-tRNA(Asn)/Glu-tRNA(Gln) amidotransferase subunit GatB [Candidatus Paceibacterota bacterium]
MYKPTIGLEIHVGLNTKSKMFCSCVNNSSEKEPNKNVCSVCLGHPGTLPVANKEAIKKVIKAGLSLNCEIARETKFDRKNYFYPDLPKGYQISQYDKPICKGGFLIINGKKIRITRIHLEEDTGRINYLPKEKSSLIDFNRAGVPLMELVTEPDIGTGKEAVNFAKELQLIFRYIDISDADMEKGQMRVEVNISISKDDNLGTKVEIKNLNSFRVVEKAIDYEIKRQTDILEKGEKVVQETRGWHDKKEITFSQREKEQAHDYRYFPEPDLPVFNFSEEFIKEITIPELPEQKRERFRNEYFLKEKDIEVFVKNKDLGNYFEKVISELYNWKKEIDIKKGISKEEKENLSKLASNYIISDFQGLLGILSVDKSKITPENFAEFIILLYKGEILSKMAKNILEKMFKTGADPSHIIEEEGIKKITNRGEIEKTIEEVILENEKAFDDYKKGKENALQFLTGKVMAKTKGMADPKAVSKVLEVKISAVAKVETKTIKK